MTSRRAALAEVPNAVNSPLRTVAPIGGKRTRAQTGEQKDVVHGQPPTKKQAFEAVEYEDENADPGRRVGLNLAANEKLEELFSKQRPNHAPTALERKLASAREKKPTSQARSERPHKQQADNLDSVRQWQKHYRRQFPGFVFYFDNIPDDVRAKYIRQIHSLGAREERFFSKAVTHVVTARPIPADTSSANIEEETGSTAIPPKTTPASASAQDQRRTTSLLDAHLHRRSQHTAIPSQLTVDNRRSQTPGPDILSRARALGIKTWAQEKLGRVLSAILDTDSGDQPREVRGQVTTRAAKHAKDANLEQLLRHEKVNGPTDRDMTVSTQDMQTMTGYYVYVFDQDERTKPVLVRDHKKPEVKEDGTWPQFRLSGEGRCPFIEDQSHVRKLQQRDEQRERESIAKAPAKHELSHRQTEAVSTLLTTQSHALVEREINLRRSPRKMSQVTDPHLAKAPNPPTVGSTRRQSSTEMPPLHGSAQASLRSLPRIIGREPMASGIQRSNVTSAIRSQAISSAAISSTAPGLNRRIGDTKEVSLLKRKVFSNNSVPSSRVTDVRAAINKENERPTRAAKRKALETLGVVNEDDEAGLLGHRSRATTSTVKRTKVAKEAKPGYCENCRDKFDDFDEHIESRKHRKFALTQENWAALDSLLAELKRPLANDQRAH